MSLNDLLNDHWRTLSAAGPRDSSDGHAAGPIAAVSREGEADTPPRPSVYMHAGQMFASPVGTEVTTILGSCVAICIWDAGSGVGGVNHYMLSYDRGAASHSLRYGDYATEQLLLALSRFGAVSSRLEAKIFGGACILQSFQQAGSELGQKNVELARTLLKAARIPVLSEDVGGSRGRKLIFSTDSGEALVKRL
jgi:chemotaxis protein CheD